MLVSGGPWPLIRRHGKGAVPCAGVPMLLACLLKYGRDPGLVLLLQLGGEQCHFANEKLSPAGDGVQGLACSPSQPNPRRRNPLSLVSRDKLGNGDLGRPKRAQQRPGNDGANEGEGHHDEGGAAVPRQPIRRGHHEPSVPIITHDRQRTNRRPVSSGSGLGPRRHDAACATLLRAGHVLARGALIISRVPPMVGWLFSPA